MNAHDRSYSTMVKILGEREENGEEEEGERKEIGQMGREILMCFGSVIIWS